LFCSIGAGKFRLAIFRTALPLLDSRPRSPLAFATGFQDDSDGFNVFLKESDHREKMTFEPLHRISQIAGKNLLSI
jgi:hypothetical protein